MNMQFEKCPFILYIDKGHPKYNLISNCSA